MGGKPSLQSTLATYESLTTPTLMGPNLDHICPDNCASILSVLILF